MKTPKEKLDHILMIILIVTSFIWAIVGIQEIFLNSDKLDKLGRDSQLMGGLNYAP